MAFDWMPPVRPSLSYRRIARLLKESAKCQKPIIASHCARTERAAERITPRFGGEIESRLLVAAGVAAQTEIVLVIRKAAIEMQTGIGWSGGPSNEFVHVEALAIPLGRLVGATVRDITRNDEHAAPIFRRGGQDYDSEPIKFVRIPVGDEVTVTEVSRLDRDAL
jgi:hypothetical protein